MSFENVQNIQQNILNVKCCQPNGIFREILKLFCMKKLFEQNMETCLKLTERCTSDDGSVHYPQQQ